MNNHRNGAGIVVGAAKFRFLAFWAATAGKWGLCELEKAVTVVTSCLFYIVKVRTVKGFRVVTGFQNRAFLLQSCNKAVTSCNNSCNKGCNKNKRVIIN